ncbi:MAG: hypothetical protein R3B09_20100 [Nannocystaceae bacterium]
MLNRILLTTTTLLVLALQVAACDSEPVDSADALDLRRATALLEEGEILRVDGPDTLCAADLFPDDADFVEGELDPSVLDDLGELAFTSVDPQDPVGVGDCDLADPRYTWTQWKIVDNACGSCLYQGNKPGWQRALMKQTCDLCSCNGWQTDTLYCWPC